MTQQHRIIPCRVGIEFLEGQLFMTKVFQRPVGQFVTASIVIAGHDSCGLDVMGGPGCFEHSVDRLTLANVGDHDGIGPKTRQMELMAFIEQTAVYRSPKTLPVTSPAPVFNILPSVFVARTKPLPYTIIQLSNHGFDVLVYLTATDITDLEFFAALENLLIEKAAIHTDNNRDILPIIPADFINHVRDHLGHRIAVVGVFVPTSENGIDNEATPVHLQRLKPLFAFIRRFYSLTTIGIIIVHHHGVESQLDHIRRFDPQAPDEQGLQQSPEQKDPRPGKCFEKALDTVGRGHLFFIGFDAAGVTGILGQLIKISHMPAGAVDHKAQNRLKKFEDGNALFGFADRPEISVQNWENTDGVHIGDKQGKTGSTGQSFTGLFDAVDLQFLFAIIFASLPIESSTCWVLVSV